MKKNDKKAIKAALTEQIAASVQAVIVNFTPGSKKIEKLIGKNTRQLVKKLAKHKLSLPATEVTEVSEAPVEKVKKATKAKV